MIDNERFEWLKWRRLGVGSSDASAIMGESPYSTALDIYFSKINDVEEKEPNYAMQLGNTLEPIARARYEILSDADFPPANFVHVNSPHYRCSLDGFNVDLNKAIEIKYCGVSFKDEVPLKYKAQLQWQYTVTLCDSLDYVQIDNMNRIHVIPVERDNEYIVRLIDTVNWFWDCVQKRDEDKVRVFSDNMFLTVEGVTYTIGVRNLKKALKKIQGKEYVLKRLHNGVVLTYADFETLYNKKKVVA